MLVNSENVQLRSHVKAADTAAVLALVQGTGFFTAAEEAVAGELVQERLDKGEASGYHFLLAECERQLIAYSCFGPIPCTRDSFDLYWIAVRADLRGQGVGKWLLLKSEDAVRQLDGRRVYIETSARALYQPTQAFYAACGYRVEARLEDFYAPGDAKLIYVKAVAATSNTTA